MQPNKELKMSYKQNFNSVPSRSNCSNAFVGGSTGNFEEIKTNKMNKSNIIFSAFCIIVGIVIGLLFSNIFYVKKLIKVKINNGQASFESNVNRDGDTYTIIIDKDTVSKGIVVDGEWR